MYTKLEIDFAELKINHLQGTCIRKNLPFDITLDQMLLLLSITHCQATGIELSFPSGRRGHVYNTRTFDRIDHKKGYVYDNILVVSQIFNNKKALYEDTRNRKHLLKKGQNIIEVVKDIVLQSLKDIE